MSYRNNVDRLWYAEKRKMLFKFKKMFDIFLVLPFLNVMQNYLINDLINSCIYIKNLLNLLKFIFFVN